MSPSDPPDPTIPEEVPQPIEPEMDPTTEPEIPVSDPPPHPGDWRPRD